MLPPKKSLRQTGSGIFLARVGRCRPGDAEENVREPIDGYVEKFC